ncbi:MAG: alpha/beta hydrolase [Proteobacteria bacterium]|nr:alpha/beta hydrolase [Pseudomonadota bacterium]
MIDQSRSHVEGRLETVEFVLPKPTATLDLAMDDGAPISVVRHGNPSGPRVVLSHGNGFASDSYFPFWRLMLEHFDLALFDLRNCGRNPFHAAEPHDYPRFARDNVAVHDAIAKEWGAKTTIGVFHSMSAIAALLAVVDGVWHWDALVLFDPPVVPPEGNPLRGPLMTAGELLRNAAQSRQNWFRDPEELADVFRHLYRFRRLRKGVAELNARSVLRFDPESGAWLLCCPGPVEAGLYVEVAGLSIWRKPAPPARPLLIVGSDPEPEDAAKTAACCKLFCKTFGIDYAVVPDTSHLLQLEEPEQCFALFSNFLADNQIGA